MNDKGLAERVILFARFLKHHGFKVFPSSVVDAFRSLEQGGISERRDFYNILRSNFTSSDLEWTLFQRRRHSPGALLQAEEEEAQEGSSS